MNTTPNYQTNNPKGWCGDPRRGAALGRCSLEGTPDFSGKLYVRKVRLDSGGYDSNGTYFGTGDPLYWVASADGSIDRVCRARDRYDAASKALRWYPNARFYLREIHDENR